MPPAALPATVPVLLQALEGRDLHAVRAAFTPDAAIHDEGAFPGSPLTFHWHLALDGDRISGLRITL